MATSTLEFDCPEGDTTLTVELRLPTVDATTASAAATEGTTDKGSYTCSFVNVASALYKLRVRDAANITIARGLLQHANVTGNERPASMDWGSIAAPTSVVDLSGTTVGTVSALAAAALDGISTTAPAGVASNFREMLVQLFRRFFNKATQTDTQIKTYADNGTSVLTTQVVSDDGTTETQNAAT